MFLIISGQSEHRSFSKNSYQSEETLWLKKYIRRRLEGLSHSFHRMSTAYMAVTDCVSSNCSMEYYENKLRTFATYPKQMLPDKFQLARAGLYYTGKSDICQYFQCHVKLSSWERDDDPTKEHFKCSRNCKYMKMIEAPTQRHSG